MIFMPKTIISKRAAQIWTSPLQQERQNIFKRKCSPERRQDETFSNQIQDHRWNYVKLNKLNQILVHGLNNPLGFGVFFWLE